MNVIAQTTLFAVLAALGLALAAPVGAAETELVGAQTPCRVFLRLGPYVGRKDGKLVGRDSRPLDLAKAEVVKTWAAGHSPSPADGSFGAGFDDSGWGRYQTDELGEKTGGYGGSFEQPMTRDWSDRFCLRTCFGISDPECRARSSRSQRVSSHPARHRPNLYGCGRSAASRFR